MTLATKNGALILKDGKLAENCGCCDKCAFAGVPQSIELDVTASGGGGLYAATTYRDRAWVSGFGYVGDIISIAKSYYCRPVESGTYSLALLSLLFNGNNASYSYTDGRLSVSGYAALTQQGFLGSPGSDAFMSGAGLKLEFSGIAVAVSFAAGDQNAALPVKTEQEMSGLYDSLAASGNETDNLHYFQSGNRPQQREFGFYPYTQAKYRCSGTGAQVSVFTTDFGFDSVAGDTLFPFSFQRRRSNQMRAFSPNYFQSVGLSFLGSAGLELGSFVGDWDVQAAQFGDQSQFTSYIASFEVFDNLVVSQCRAVFADGTTKILPLG